MGLKWWSLWGVWMQWFNITIWGGYFFIKLKVDHKILTIIERTFYEKFNFPPGSKSEALQRGVQLNFLIFYQDLIIEYGDFFFILVVGGGWWVGSHFLFLQISNSHKSWKNTCGFYIFDKLESFPTIFEITLVGKVLQKWFWTSRS